MLDRMSRFFSSEDMERIKVAVKEAETKTSGEIVPYVVLESDTYEEALWRGGSIAALLALAKVVVLNEFMNLWFELNLIETVLVTLLAVCIAALLVKFLEPLKRLLAGHRLMERRVAQRASEAFIAEEVFKTKHRTGILIFVSLFEHKVLIVGDSGINAKVKQSDWDGIVQLVVKAITAGKPADGLVEAIRLCGELLQKHGLPIERGDTDELSDSLRI